MTSAEEKYATALAAAIADDLRAHSPGAPLARVVLRWSEEDDPLYFTVHALADAQRSVVDPADAWSPLEWPNVEQELDRADRLVENADVQRAGAALKVQYDAAAPSEDDEWRPSTATVETVRRLPAALDAAGLARTADFAAAAAHFEGWGALDVLKAVTDAATLAALEARHELPTG